MIPKTILITGGHPTPAIACIDHIKSVSPDTKIYFIGRRQINPKEKNDTLEYQEIAGDRNIEFFNSLAKRGWKGLWDMPKSISQAIKIIDKTKPDSILSFGGYISAPVCIAGMIRHIPYYLHEQTSKPGNANRLLGLFAEKIFVAFEDTSKDFSQFPWLNSKVIFTGNPLRLNIFENHGKPALLEGLNSPILFVNGGNMGSHAINTHIFKIIPELLLNVSVIHQVGNIEEFGDREKAQKIRDEMSNMSRHKYVPLNHLKTKEMSAVFQHSDFVLSRSGANTFFELIALKKPAIIVPLPYSARDEQEEQAQILADHGVAEIFDQSQSSNILYDRIMAVAKSIQNHQKSYAKLTKFTKINAASDIWNQIIS